MLLCQGTAVGGWTFYIKDGKLHYAHNYVAGPSTGGVRPTRCPRADTSCASSSSPPASPTSPTARAPRVGPSSTSTAPGRADRPAGHHPDHLHPGRLTCGANPGSAVTPDYQAPFRFTGTLHSVTVDLSGDLIVDTRGELRMAMARQ